MEKFSLNSRLKADTIKIAAFELSELLLMNDKNYPWFILVPRRSNISEIFQLNDQDQTQLYKEISKRDGHDFKEYIPFLNLTD